MCKILAKSEVVRFLLFFVIFGFFLMENPMLIFTCQRSPPLSSFENSEIWHFLLDPNISFKLKLLPNTSTKICVHVTSIRNKTADQSWWKNWKFPNLAIFGPINSIFLGFMGKTFSQVWSVSRQPLSDISQYHELGVILFGNWKFGQAKALINDIGRSVWLITLAVLKRSPWMLAQFVGNLST